MRISLSRSSSCSPMVGARSPAIPKTPERNEEKTMVAPMMAKAAGVISFHRVLGEIDAQRRNTSPQPKSDISDFGQLMVPNSGKPEFGQGRGEERLRQSHENGS